MGLHLHEGVQHRAEILDDHRLHPCLLYTSINLLRGGQQGEKEPRVKWPLLVIGLLSLGGGYFIALTVKSPLDALLLFFVAVILVIIGTYCLFTAGSIALLKALKRKKSFYYKPGNFIAVSGMLYRDVYKRQR